MKKMLFIAVILFCNLAYATKSDPDDIKKFRETNNCPSCNLSEASMYDHHQHANLINANLSNASLAGDYTLADFTGCNGVGAWFASASGAKFINSVLIKARLSGNFTDADFSNANVTGADFSDANLYHAKLSNEQLSSAYSVCRAILPDGAIGKCK